MAITKTEAKRQVAALRREAAKVTLALTPTPEWILREMNQEPMSQAEVDRIIRTALDSVDRLSASLRRGLVSR